MSETILTTSDGRFRVVLDYDESAENPRTWADPLSGALTVPDRSYHDVPESGPLADQWDRLMSTYGPSRLTGTRGQTDRALTIMERYVRLCGGVSDTFTPYAGPTALLYIVPTMMESAGFPPAEITTERMTELLRGELSELRSWSDGEVYVVTVEQRIEWVRADADEIDGPADTMQTWEVVESLGNVIGNQYMVETAGDLLADAIGVTVRPAAFTSGNSVATGVICPGCGQEITVTDTSKTECGGEGEGSCEPSSLPDMDAYVAAFAAHQRAIETAAPFLD